MNYGAIKKNDIANGEGVRITLFVSGCTHHCKGCFQPETWNFDYGQPFTEETENYILDLLKPDYVKGLTLLGGEPMEIENQKVLNLFLRKVKSKFSNKDVWCYTGYTLENDLMKNGKVHCECTDEMLNNIDILVDGEFKQELKNLKLKFRGSSNQRIIDLKKTLKEGKISLWEGLKNEKM